MTRNPIRTVFSVVAVLALLLAACDSDDSSSGDDTGTESGTDSGDTTTDDSGNGELVGTFAVDAGVCDAGGFSSGSYLKLVLPDGTVSDGPFFENPDSGCDDKTFTTVSPGADGGLVTGSYQPAPDPAFDADGNSLADAVIEPTPFTAIAFSISTNEVDPQLDEEVDAPAISVSDGELSGQVSAVVASWNNEFFNQGSPKPDGSAPGLTAPVTGTYDEATGAYVLEWSSQIVGGPFNDFTGIWHLEGTFTP